ncbi:GNAT family N-acetyltransferase [Erwinia sp. Eh17-17]|uniref:GNAT family N-acetyltransferase n=1 Tax=Erwinia sp. Eh17-17 TaxID=3080330 RepID=UPI00320909FC
MSLMVLTQLAEIPASQWDALAPNDQPFMRHAFLSALEESGAVSRHSGWLPQHLLWVENGVPRAAMPGYAKTHSMGEYVFDHAWAEASERAGIPYYPKWLSAVPFSPVSGARVLGDEQAATQLLQAVPTFLEQQQLYSGHINFSDDRVRQALQQDPLWLPRLGCQYHWHNRGFRDFQDFLDLLTSRKRKQLRKERELVARQGVEFVWYQGAELDETQWDFVYACYANTYLIRGRQPYLPRTFFSLLAERMPQAIRVTIASQRGEPVAMAFSLVDGDTFYGRYWGCLEEFNRLHFETCFYQGMEYAIAHGLKRFDAGAQGEHKLIRGFEPVLTESWHRLRHPGLHAAVADFLQQERDGVQAWAAEARSALPWRQSLE